MMTWEQVEALLSAFTPPGAPQVPQPDLWRRARRSRKGWASEPGAIVRKDLPVEAVRYTHTQTGGTWHGWIVREIFGKNHSEPIATRAEALQQLMAWE